MPRPDEYTGIEAQRDPDFLTEVDDETISEKTKEVYKDLKTKFTYCLCKGQVKRKCDLRLGNNQCVSIKSCKHQTDKKPSLPISFPVGGRHPNDSRYYD